MHLPVLPDPVSLECDCHEWHDVDEIGEWPHSLAGGRASQPKSVRNIVSTEPIRDRSELSHQELTARIIAAGCRIDHAHTLSAMTFTDRRIRAGSSALLAFAWGVAGVRRLGKMVYVLRLDGVRRSRLPHLAGGS